MDFVYQVLMFFRYRTLLQDQNVIHYLNDENYCSFYYRDYNNNVVQNWLFLVKFVNEDYCNPKFHYFFRIDFVQNKNNYLDNFSSNYFLYHKELNSVEDGYRVVNENLHYYQEKIDLNDDVK